MLFTDFFKKCFQNIKEKSSCHDANLFEYHLKDTIWARGTIRDDIPIIFGASQMKWRLNEHIQF